MRHTIPSRSIPEMVITAVRLSDTGYPAALATYLGEQAPEIIFALGNTEILRCKTLALFCSVKCPGNLILRTYDFVRELRDAGVAVISGFHSPMEKECLAILLRGKQPVVWCPAKRLTVRRLPMEYAAPMSEGRLLMLSPFAENIRRATSDIALIRNEFVAALAERVFIAHAAPGGKTEAFCRKLIAWGKPLLTFDCPENSSLLAIGASPCGALSTGDFTPEEK